MQRSGEEKDYYRVLGVSPAADQETIGSAYRRLMKTVHPDARRGRSDPGTGRRVAELVEAWRVLGNPARRSAYDDARLAGGRPFDGAGYRPERLEPILEVLPKALDLGEVRRGEMATGLVCLHNRGGSATKVERLDTAPSWVSVSRTEAGPPTVSSPVGMSVRVDTSRLAPRRRYQTELVFRLANPRDGLHSSADRVAIAVTVAPKQPPRLKVRPAGWVVSAGECRGAPRSLLLHLFLVNSGGESASGTLRGEPWMRVTPQEFGGLRPESGPLHFSVEVDCQGWESAGRRDGTVLVSTEDGDLMEVTLVARANPTEAATRAGPGPRSLALMAAGMAALPALAAVVGSWPVALFLALAVGLSLPAVLHRLHLRQLLDSGPAGEIEGWQVGPRAGGLRLWLVALGWAVLGSLLAAASAEDLLAVLPAPTIVGTGAFAGVVAILGAVASDSQLFCLGTATGRRRRIYLSALGPVVGSAWGVLAALILRGVGVASAAPLGGAVGWLLGSAVVLARNPDMRSDRRRVMTGLLWDVVPVVSSAAGFAAALGVAAEWGLGARRVAAYLLEGVAPGAPLPLLALPAASLSSAVVALVACGGLLLGFALGLLSVLPIIDAPPMESGVTRWPFLVYLQGLTMDMIVRHAGAEDIEQGARQEGIRASLSRYLLEVHWSTVVVGAGAALLLLYVAAHLLLALSAAIGAMVG